MPLSPAAYGVLAEGQHQHQQTHRRVADRIAHQWQKQEDKQRHPGHAQVQQALTAQLSGASGDVLGREAEPCLRFLERFVARIAPLVQNPLQTIAEVRVRSPDLTKIPK